MTNGERQGEGSLLALALLALVAGALAGLVGAIFRLCLEQSDRLRNVMIARGHGWEAGGFLLVIAGCAAATALAAWLVRRYSPHASGSGIPHVEAVVRGELPQAPFRLIPVKLFAGLLAIGSGLALGREGPSVQMGASLAHLVGTVFGRSWPDCRVLVAAGAGAGLGTAFNAPIAGAVFVLEELVQRFEHRIAIVALAASASALGVARVLLGDAPDFHVNMLGYGDAGTKPLYFAFGAFAGFLAVAYNRMLLATLATARRLSAAPVELRAGLVGAAVGILGWFAPGLIGGGDAITQSVLAGSVSLAAIPAVFLIRFALSYAAGTPGRAVRAYAGVGSAIRVCFWWCLPGSAPLPECSA
jgi:CIC family chloride channel protein